MAKIILEEQERSLPTFEEPIGVEVDAKVLNEIVAKEESTSPEPIEMKKEVEKTILKMTLWGEVHEKVENEILTPILEVDETILE